MSFNPFAKAVLNQGTLGQISRLGNMEQPSYGLGFQDVQDSDSSGLQLSMGSNDDDGFNNSRPLFAPNAENSAQQWERGSNDLMKGSDFTLSGTNFAPTQTGRVSDTLSMGTPLNDSIQRPHADSFTPFGGYTPFHQYTPMGSQNQNPPDLSGYNPETYGGRQDIKDRLGLTGNQYLKAFGRISTKAENEHDNDMPYAF